MNRRNLLKNSAALGFAAALPTMPAAKLFAGAGPGQMESSKTTETAKSNPLAFPAKGPIPVAFPISDGAEVIDFGGPWEIFDAVAVPGTNDNAFQLYTVTETMKPITATGGMKIIPDHTFETAPAPKLIVIPAQAGETKAMLNWIRTSTKEHRRNHVDLHRRIRVGKNGPVIG